MGSSIDTVQFICDQAGMGPRLTYRKMFGEYALYLDGKVIALVCDDQLFLKPTPEGRAFLGPVREAPPYPGIRPFPVLSAELDDPERLAIAFEVTARALPPPKPKKPKVPKADRAKTTRAGARAKGLPKTGARRKAKASTKTAVKSAARKKAAKKK